MHMAIFGAFAAALGLLGYILLAPRFPDATVMGYAMRYGVPIVLGASTGVILHFI